MKKILLPILVLFISNQIFAQKGFEIGAGIMPQSTWLFSKTDSDAGDELDYAATFNLAYGVQAGYNFSHSMGVETGLLLSTQGQKYTQVLLSTKINTERRLNYAKVPILFKFNTNPDAKTMFVFKVGPQFNFLTGADYYLDDEKIELTDTQGKPVDFKTAFKSSEIDLAFGFGPTFNIGNAHINLLLRFDYGFGDAENKDISGVISYPDDREAAHNTTGGILLGFSYTFGGDKE